LCLYGRYREGDSKPQRYAFNRIVLKSESRDTALDLPGCIEAIVEIPGGLGEVELTIDYTYDALYCMTG